MKIPDINKIAVNTVSTSPYIFTETQIKNNTKNATVGLDKFNIV